MNIIFKLLNFTSEKDYEFYQEKRLCTNGSTESFERLTVHLEYILNTTFT